MKKVVIDAGHGGEDPGAVGNGIIEKDYTLKISKYIYDKLKQLGVDVKLTRDGDITLSPSERTKKVLDSYGNSNDVLVISNHINAGGGDGAEVIYALRNTEKFPKLVLDNLKSKGQNVRKYYRRTLPSNPSKDYYFMLRDTGNTDAYIIEYGFLDSKQDDVSQLKNNWQSYADAVVEAIIEYLGIPKLDDSTYTVKRGDTLWNIAKANNISVDKLKEINNLNSNLISIGQVLNLNDNYYVIKKGDTLYSIAKLYNTTVNNLMALNNLTNYNIYIGQKIKVK